MALVREAYALAEDVREQSPDTARRLRRAAVSVPAHIAAAVNKVVQDRPFMLVTFASGKLELWVSWRRLGAARSLEYRAVHP